MPKGDGTPDSRRRRTDTPSRPTRTDAVFALEQPTGRWSAGPVHRVATPLREQVFDVLRKAIFDADLKLRRGQGDRGLQRAHPHRETGVGRLAEIAES